MSLSRFAKKRDTAEPDIVKALCSAGARVWKLDRPFDLLVGHRGRFLVYEVKSNTRKPDPRQKKQTDELKAAQAGGLPVHLVRTVDEALAALGSA